LTATKNLYAISGDGERFQKMKHADDEQDSVGRFIAEAVNEKLLREVDNS